MTIEYATALDIGNRKRREGGVNEDSVAVNVLEEGHLDADRRAGVFVLADGAGGARAGDVASYIATVEVTRRLTRALWDARRFGETDRDGAGAARRLGETAVADPLAGGDADWILDRIETAIQSTHTRILQAVDAHGLGTAYTTIVAGVKAGDHLYYGWVGDSRLYVVNDHPDLADGERIRPLTQDHSVVEQLLQRGEIDDVESHVHRQGNRITRALGGAADEDPVASSIAVDTNYVELFAEDTVLFTSDGLVDAYADAPELHEEYRQADDTASVERRILEKAVTDDEIRDVLLEADSLEAAADRYVTLSNQRGGKDNISVILFRDRTLDSSPTEAFPTRDHDRTTGVTDLANADSVIRDPD